MAKNYTFAEAVEIINAGTDMESIADIGRRYPILLHKVATVTAKAGDAFVDLMSYMPDHLTANKVNSAMKNSGNDEPATDEAETEDVAETTEKAPKKAAKAAKAEAETSGSGTDYESMSGKELWDILGKAGKRKDCKEKMGGTKKELMVEYINKYGLGNDAEEEAETDEAETTDEAANPYEGKSAMELFKECKKRGIKAESKKPAKFYADLLMKADAEAETESESEDDGWGEEAEEQEEPKAEKKPAKKAGKKAAKEEPADDDDDWDI